jgi:single-strand DNA-binding protein
VSLNKVMLIGRLTRDPEMRYTPSGQPVTTFSIATNRYGGGTDGERREFTDYHNIVAWNIGRRNLAELVAQYTKKGSQVYVEGRLQTRSWDGQDGQKRRATEVVLSDIQFLDSRGGTGASGGGREGGAGDPGFPGRWPEGGRPPSEEEPPPPLPEDPGAGVRDVDPDEIPF